MALRADLKEVSVLHFLPALPKTRKGLVPGPEALNLTPLNPATDASVLKDELLPPLEVHRAWKPGLPSKVEPLDPLKVTNVDAAQQGPTVTPMGLETMVPASAVPAATPSAPAPRAEMDANRATFFFLIRISLLSTNGPGLLLHPGLPFEAPRMPSHGERTPP